MGKGSQNFSHLDRSGSARHADKVGRGSWVRDHVHADSALASALKPLSIAHHDAGDGEDHDDLDGYGEDTDEGAQGTVDKVADDKFIHASTSVWESGMDRVGGPWQKG